MKKFKKNPKKQLEKFSNIFMQLGLVLVLFIVFVTLEHQTAKNTVGDLIKPTDESTVIFDHTPPLIVREIKEVQTKKRVERQQPVYLDQPVEVSNNDVIETNIVQEEDIPVLNDTDIVEVILPDEIDNSDDPININFVQKAPVFSGCEGLTEIENRKCFEKNMKRLVRRHFNVDLASELGLPSGKKSIYTQFVIDKEGNVVDIKVKAPHPRLVKEANRIVKKLPKFKPGIQNDQPVKVKYTLPISFMVE
jgi:protein TonB